MSGALIGRLLAGALPDSGISLADGGAGAGAAVPPVDRAIAAAFVAEGIGPAFAAGYRAALEALVPACAGVRASLAATEAGGVHPRAIRTTLAPAPGGGLVLSGRKRWTTMAREAEVLLVLATTGSDEQGRPRLRLVRLPADRAGITITPMPPTPFTPEIAHAEVALADVTVDEAEVLPGDGWVRYLKPFRTVEDAHVHAALVAHLLGAGCRAGWPRALLAELAAVLVGLRAAALDDPSDAGTHVALAGSMALAVALFERSRACWDRVDEAVRARWERDAPLLQVAASARAARLEKAWERIEAARAIPTCGAPKKAGCPVPSGED